MGAGELLQTARHMTVTSLTWAGDQNFLGAKRVKYILSLCPVGFRESLALRLLSLSPHYFYDSDVRAEADRNESSRAALAEALVMPYVTEGMRVIDYGCGPGYMASAVACRASHVDAVDISCGVLECAKVLNGRENIAYLQPHEVNSRPSADLAYSFAVVQHLSRESLAKMLGLISSCLRRSGTLILHFAVPGQQGYRTEEEWLSDRTLKGRLRLRYGLNCFGRTPQEMAEVAEANGFGDIKIQNLSGSLNVPGEEDITRQHLLTAQRC